MSNAYFLLDVSTKVDPSAGAAAATTAGNAATTATTTAGGMNPIFMIIIYCVVIFGVMYIFSIKPQKKREKQMAEMRANIKVGDSVMLNTGMFGRIADVTAECYVVEFGMNKGIRIPVLKSEVMAVREPNLSNKVAEPEPQAEKKSLFGGFAKKKEEEPSDESK